VNLPDDRGILEGKLILVVTLITIEERFRRVNCSLPLAVCIIVYLFLDPELHRYIHSIATTKGDIKTSQSTP
jgi:hypothetical protein